MANYFSDLLSNNQDAVPSQAFHAPAGTHGVEVTVFSTFEMNAATVAVPIAAADVVGMIRLPWNVRLTRLLASSDDLGGTIDGDLGIYSSDIGTGIGAVQSVKIFDDDLTLEAVLGDDDVFTANTLTDMDRGRTLWDLAGLTEHPNDGSEAIIAWTVTTATSPVVGGWRLEAKYLANA